MTFAGQPQDLQSPLGEMLSYIVCCSLDYVMTVLRFFQDMFIKHFRPFLPLKLMKSLYYPC